MFLSWPLRAVSPIAVPRPTAYRPDSHAGRQATRQRDRTMLPFEEAMDEEIARIHFWGTDPILVNRDDWIHTVLVEEAPAFRKGPLLSVNARPLLGDGLLTGGNELNRRQRKTISPAFAHKRVAEYLKIVEQYTARETARWESGQEQEKDIPHEMLAITLGIIGEMLLGDDLLREARGVGSAVVELMNFAIDELRAPFRAFCGAGRALRNLMYLNRILRTRIHDRLHHSDDAASGEADLLTRLLLGHAAGGEEASPMPPRLVRDEMMTIFLAGVETVALGLAWTLYLVATHPDIAERLRAELDAALPGEQQLAPTADDLPRLPLTLAVFKESLRLYPPAYLLARQALREVKVGPYRLPRGTVVFVSPYVQHRRPANWSDPLRFDPDRWLGESRPAANRYGYLPFGGGPRVCVGAHFAQMESHLMLAYLLRRFTFALTPDHPPVVPEPLFTLRPRNGLRMVVKKRFA